MVQIREEEDIQSCGQDYLPLDELVSEDGEEEEDLHRVLCQVSVSTDQDAPLLTMCSSETGTAKKYAKEAAELFNMSYKTQLMALDQPSSKIRESIHRSDIELIVVSTFGNGESPEMARPYVASINQLVENFVNNDPDTLKLMEYAKKKHFAVFGLGSSAYPKFAAFGKHLNQCYTTLGANPMVPFTAGDELKDQKGSFKKWLRKAFIASLNIMQLEAPKAFLERINAIKQYRCVLIG